MKPLLVSAGIACSIYLLKTQSEMSLYEKADYLRGHGLPYRLDHTKRRAELKAAIDQQEDVRAIHYAFFTGIFKQIYEHENREEALRIWNDDNILYDEKYRLMTDILREEDPGCSSELKQYTDDYNWALSHHSRPQ